MNVSCFSRDSALKRAAPLPDIASNALPSAAQTTSLKALPEAAWRAASSWPAFWLVITGFWILGVACSPGVAVGVVTAWQAVTAARNNRDARRVCRKCFFISFTSSPILLLCQTQALPDPLLEAAAQRVHQTSLLLGHPRIQLVGGFIFFAPAPKRISVPALPD